MPELHVLYAVLGATAVALALVSRRLREVPVSEPLVALVLGVVVGPAALGWFVLEPEARDLVLLEGSRLLLAASVMAAALRFRARDLRDVVRPVLILIAVAMPLAAVVTGALTLLVGLPLTLAAVVGACMAPTDPVLAASVVTGEPAERDLPGRVRRMLTAESGINDGLALALVGVAVTAALPGDGITDALGRVTWEVVGGTAIGLVLGALTALAIRRATADRALEAGPELVLTLLLALGTLGVARVAHTGGVLAVFVAGIAYNAVLERGGSAADEERSTQDRVDEAINRYAVLPLFAVLGATLPWDGWAALGPAAIAVVVGVLLLRRLPLVLLLAKPLGLRPRDAVVVGWFGPMGVSAVFYLAHARHEGLTDPTLDAVGTLLVAASVVAFGVTGSPARRAYARLP